MAMYGAIIGDILGSAFEGSRFLKGTEDFIVPGATTFTDDTILTCAVAYSILKNIKPEDSFRHWYHKYRKKSFFGGQFKLWAEDINKAAPKSFGNGAAMRISPVAMLYEKLEDAEHCCLKLTNITSDTSQLPATYSIELSRGM
jgi:ADP-ribosylglycohydrolase